jgi:hypothetical protein
MAIKPQVVRRRQEVFPRAACLEDGRAIRHGRFATLTVLELAPVLDRGYPHLHCSSSDVIASIIARVGSSGEGDITSSMRSYNPSTPSWD